MPESMSRLNGRVHHTGPAHNPVQYQPVPTQYAAHVPAQYPDNTLHREEFEPTCLVRTPSGNVYIPSGDVPKSATMDYTQNLTPAAIHSPMKDTHKTMDSYNARFGGSMGIPVIPMRNNVRREPLTPSAYDSAMIDRGGSSRRHLSFQSGGSKMFRCSWRCTAVIFITVAVVLAVLLGFVAVSTLVSSGGSDGDCGVMPAKITPTADQTPINQSPSRGNQIINEDRQEIILTYGVPGHFQPLPHLAVLETIGIDSPELPRMRRSVSHDEELSMISQSSSPAPPLLFSPTTRTASADPSPTTTPESTHYTNPPHTIIVNEPSESTAQSIHESTSSSQSHINNVVDEKKSSFKRLTPASDILQYALYDEQLDKDVTEEDSVEFIDAFNETSDDYEYNEQTSATARYEFKSNESRKVMTVENSSHQQAAASNVIMVNIPFPANDLPDISTEQITSRGTPLISLLDGGQRPQYERSSTDSTNDTSSAMDANTLMNDDAGSKGGARNLWSLGWVFNKNNKPLNEANHKHPANLNPPTTKDHIYASFDTGLKRIQSTQKGGPKMYSSFSTWPKNDRVFKKGGFADPAVINYDKGGKIIHAETGPTNKVSHKRSANIPVPRHSSLDKRETTTKDSKRTLNKSYDPLDPAGGSIPMSDPSHYPSEILKSVGVHKRVDTTPGYTSGRDHQSKGGNTAIDVFPHLFEYDLPEHDDYYYDDDKYWFDEFWTKDQDKTTDEINPHSSEYSSPIIKSDPPKPVEATSESPALLPQFPAGLKVMSLTREQFHIEADPSPLVVSLSQTKKEEHLSVSKKVKNVSGNMHSEDSAQNNDHIIYYGEDIQIVPLSEDVSATNKHVTDDKMHPNSRKKSDNEVYTSPVETEDTHIVSVEKLNSSRPANTEAPLTTQAFIDTTQSPMDVKFETDSVLGAINPTVQPAKPSVFKEALRQRPYVVHAYPHYDQDTTHTDNGSSHVQAEVTKSTNTEPEHTKPHTEHRIPQVIVQQSSAGLEALDTTHHLGFNSSRHAKRVTVNVTITTDDEEQNANKSLNKPFYVLSVSVPTSGDADNAQIQIFHPQPKPLDGETPGNTTSPPKTHGNSTPGMCSCPCQPAVQSGSTTPQVNTTVAPPTTSSGCVIVVQSNATDRPTTPLTTTVATLPPHIFHEMEEHQQRPQKTIPPDGTTFKRMKLGEKLKHSIPPYGYWNMQFHQPESAYVKFEVSVPRGASLGIYGRRNALPTHTSYDFIKVLSGYKVGSRRNTRSSMAPTQLETMVKYLEQGHWFVSVYNDDGDPQQLSFGASISSEFTEGCPKGCSGNGDCILGACRCNPGFTGRDCTEMKCPVLCSGHGEYREGQCTCTPGWKGQECSVRHDECEVPDCSGHGHCVDGRCHCAKGFKGAFCQDVDCPHPTCSDHGWCVNGTCICQKGWRSGDCSRMDDAALQCLPDCSAHGHFDLIGQQCVCEPEWTGSECNIRVCGLDCGFHGRCEGGKCLCSDGWTGDRCDLKKCDDRCEDHGQCKNGTCICMTGWNGRHCTLVGCPESCAGHGTCTNVMEEWHCSCHDGWEGKDCSMRLENVCDDSIDNDNDGLIDCADAECCSTEHCVHSTLCKSSVDPIDILLRKQPPAVTASFFQRMRFIVEESSVQIYAEMQSFNQSRASVIRGRIVSGRGSGLVGVRVSHFRPESTGFTLSRHGGWFDLMVNGGGAVKLLFGKSQFLPVTKTVPVPWNEIVVVDTVMMTTSEIVPPPPPAPCPDHNFISLKPVVLATWKHGFQGGCPHCTAILTESQVVQESLAIPGTGLQLVYHSSRAVGYESTIQLQLTPEEIPLSLRRIHLKITIEGILFEKIFEADRDIKYTFAWNRLNIYRQKVYGVTWAVVRVGYSYSNCDQIIWDTQSTQVSGHDISVSDIGGWDLSIHHRYNFHEGILQKGDGRNMYLKQRPRILKVLMGDGRQREVSCISCEGAAKRQRLLTPAALAPAPDGSLYVADFNLIRRIFPDNTVKTVVKLNETRVSYRYHLAVSPVDGTVYISDPEAHQILKVRDPDDTSRPEQNYMSYVGSGERCLPGDEIGCGDGGLARDAKLQYPKGLIVSLKEVLYFADGTNVRSVDSDGIISTVIGTHRHRAHWQPLPCSGTLSVADVSLRWPTALAISPLDESLYVLDDHHVLRLTRDGRIKVIAGRPLHCPPIGGPSDLAAHTTVRSPQSLAFDPNGNLYIAESDTERINRIRLITTDEKIHDFAGAESKCNCRDDNCLCYESSQVLAANAVFSTISAIAITPDGAVHVLDQGNLRIRSIIASIPQPNAERNYEIYSPETQELYVFNRFGHHVETRNIPTHRTIYSFIYNVNTSNGKLSSVTDAAGNKINFLRDYSGQVTMIENSRQQKCRLKMSRMRRLEEIITPDEHNVTLTYHGASGLLRSRMDSTGRAHVYDYDKYGRLTRTVTPSGQVIDLSFDLSEQGARVTVTRDGESPVVMLIKGSVVTEIIGDASKVTAQLADGSVIMRNPWGHHIATETVPYSILDNNVLASSFPVPGRQRTEIGDGLINSFDWKYYVDMSRDRSKVEQVGRRMRVNGEDLLNFKYDLFSGTEAVQNKAQVTLLNVTYDDLGRPLRWSPVAPFNPVSLTYDRYGLIQEWSWGQQREDYIYDRSGRFEGIKYADSSKITYSYKDTMSIKPYKMTVEGGTEHLLEYDEGGALAAVITPRGHKYRFELQPSVLHNRFTFILPGSPKHPYQILYSDSGHLLAKVLPQQEGRVVYSYDKAGRLQHQIFGDGSVEYGYQPETGLIRSVTLRELAYEQRIDNKYHAGLVKEQRIRFGPAVPMNAVKMRFLYDGNARPRRIEIELNGKELADYEMKYNVILGTLESIDNLKITRSNYNRSVIEDSTKAMLKIMDYNADGKLVEEALTIRGRLVHRFRYNYDLRARVASKIMLREPGAMEIISNYSYTADGFLKFVEGSESWQFRYDSNGNMVGVMEENREIPAIYDVGDRLIGWGDQEINVHDSAGRVIRQKDIHYSYTARGNIRHAWSDKGFRVTYRYDHQGRVTSWEDHQGNVTQFFYADLRRPLLPTHVHYPVTSITHTMFYDHRDHLVSMHTENGKLWIVTDNLGSPAAVYDTSGVLVKEIMRSPLGAVTKDTRPQLRIHIDFCGSIRDPITGLLLFGLYAYDPAHGQWMSPRYDQIPKVPQHIASVYIHRFRNNNPVNKPEETDSHYTDIHSWLRMFDINMDKMLGSVYHDETIDNPMKPLKIDSIEPSIRVISGLSCSSESVLNQFSRPSFLEDSLVQMDEPRLVTSKWSILGKFSSSGPVLGPGILVSRVNGRALVTLVPFSENSVVQAVARDVLNGSALLDITLPHHRHHTLYLVKEDPIAMADDLSQLQRLSGLFNVTEHEGDYPEIRVMGSRTSLVFIYGIAPEAAKRRILRHVHHRSAEHAWQAEQRLLQTGGLSLHPWTPEERQILLREGKVPGFTAAELHSVHRFPLLADDASNVVFRRDVDRRRRRSKSES